VLVGGVLLALWPGFAAARQLHVREARPAAETRGIAPANMEADHVVQARNPLLDSAADILFASGEAPPAGRYVLHWEARSMERESSAGDIPFSVAP
jgi:hypothetical protein